jgi:hypothetical protein
VFFCGGGEEGNLGEEKWAKNCKMLGVFKVSQDLVYMCRFVK